MHVTKDALDMALKKAIKIASMYEFCDKDMEYSNAKKTYRYVFSKSEVRRSIFSIQFYFPVRYYAYSDVHEEPIVRVKFNKSGTHVKTEVHRNARIKNEER